MTAERRRRPQSSLNGRRPPRVTDQRRALCHDLKSVLSVEQSAPPMPMPFLHSPIRSGLDGGRMTAAGGVRCTEPEETKPR